MKISPAGLDLIKQSEGLRLEAYPDPASGGYPWTIGYGTTRTALGSVRPGMRITEAEAEELLLADIRYFERVLNDLVKVPLTQGQTDALLSLTYNVGEGAFERSTLLKELNLGHYDEAANEFTKWIHASGKVMPGLVARRNRERNMFMAQPSPAEAEGQKVEPPTAAPPTPTERQTMPLPAAALIALGSELLKLVPWVKKNPSEAEKIMPKLMDVAKEIVPTGNEQARVEAIVSQPALREQFTAAVAVKWNDVAPFLEFESKERKEARDYAERMTSSGPAWRQVGYGFLVALLSLLIVGGIGYVFYEVLFADGDRFSPTSRDGIVEVLKNILILVVGFFFGSSIGSKSSGDSVRKIAEGK